MKRLVFILIVTLTSCWTSVKQTDKNIPDNLVTGDFDSFVKLFENRLTKIPDSYVTKYLNVDSLKYEITSIWTYESYLFSENIIGLICKFNCTAGGLCENLILITFDKSGQRIDELEVGHSYADYGSSSELTYTINRDRINLKLKETEVLEADDETDKEQVTVDTTFFYKVDINSGRFSKD